MVRSDLLQQSLTFLSKTDQNSPTTTAQDPAKLNSANIWHNVHTPLPSWKDGLSELIQDGLRYKSLKHWKVERLNGSRIWLKPFRELQWNENMVINAICDAALSGLLDWRQFWVQTMFLSNFGKREETAKLPPLLTQLNKKTPNGASALSLSLDRLPLGPSYLKSCVQIGQSN